MKKVFVLAALLFSNLAGAQSIRVSLNMEGVYQKRQPVYMHGYSNSKDCRADRGIWLKSGACMFRDGGSTVDIKTTGVQDVFNVTIGSVGTNGHLCNFEGIATKRNPVQLVMQEGQCQVVVGFTDKDSLAVWNNGQCSDYCGASMSLDISGAKRISSQLRK